MTTAVEVYEDEARTGSYLLAQGLGREHKKVRDLIEKYKEKFENLSVLKTRKLESTGGRPAVEYLLNYNQVMFLFSILRKNKQISDVTVDIIKASSVVQVIELLQSVDVDSIQVRYVYAMQDEVGRIKIGISNDPERRMREIQACNGGNINLIMVRETKNSGYKDETILHNVCSKYLIHSEWFTSDAVVQ